MQGFGNVSAIHDVFERVRKAPGVSAATVGPLPLVRVGDRRDTNVNIDGKPVQLAEPLNVAFAASDYFTTLQLPLLEGRDFNDGDQSGGELVAIVNESTAHQLWPGQDPLGRRIGFERAGRSSPAAERYTIVGVVGDARIRSLRDSLPMIYLSRRQHEPYLAGYVAGSGTAFLIVRGDINAPAIRNVVARSAREAGLSLGPTTSVDQRLGELLMPQRIGRALLALFGIVALALVGVGTSGLVSCVVTRTRREIGIRMALGAQTRQILPGFLRGALLPIAIGITCGAGFVGLAGRFVDQFMYGMTGSDTTTIIATGATVLGAGLLATLAPTRRALKINPIEIIQRD
jgi:putative ABC transport system permease protein